MQMIPEASAPTTQAPVWNPAVASLDLAPSTGDPSCPCRRVNPEHLLKWPIQKTLNYVVSKAHNDLGVCFERNASMAENLGISEVTLWRHLKILQGAKRVEIQYDPGFYRRIRPVPFFALPAKPKSNPAEGSVKKRCNAPSYKNIKSLKGESVIQSTTTTPTDDPTSPVAVAVSEPETVVAVVVPSADASPSETAAATASPLMATPAAPDPLVAELRAQGVKASDAVRLARERPEACRRQIDAMPKHQAAAKNAGKSITYPGKFLQRAIEEDYRVPDIRIRPKPSPLPISAERPAAPVEAQVERSQAGQPTAAQEAFALARASSAAAKARAAEEDALRLASKSRPTPPPVSEMIGLRPSRSAVGGLSHVADLTAQAFDRMKQISTAAPG